jgi:hypothetical protein
LLKTEKTAAKIRQERGKAAEEKEKKFRTGFKKWGVVARVRGCV